MLKGYSTTKMTVGTIIFVFVFGVMAVITARYFVTASNVATSLNDIHAMEFANLVKSRLTDDDGMISEATLSSTGSLRELGLADKYARIENLVTGEEHVFQGARSKYSHETYLTVKSNHYPVKAASRVVMRNGEAYFLHIYRVGKHDNIVIDIYPERVCSGESPDQGYRMIGCDEMVVLEYEDAGNIDKAILESRIRSVEPVTEKVTAVEDLKPVDIDIQGYSFGEPQECLDLKKKICYRTIGSFAYPAKLRVEIDPEDSFLGG